MPAIPARPANQSTSQSQVWALSEALTTLDTRPVVSTPHFTPVPDPYIRPHTPPGDANREERPSRTLQSTPAQSGEMHVDWIGKP